MSGLTNSPDWTVTTEWREEGIPIIPLSDSDRLRGAALQQAYLDENIQQLTCLAHDESIDWDYIEQLEDEQAAYEEALRQHENNRQEVSEDNVDLSSESTVSIVGLTTYCHQCGHVGLPDDSCVRCDNGHYQTLLLSQEQIVRHQHQW